MKVVKTASSIKISLSRREWKSIGRQNGWLPNDDISPPVETNGELTGEIDLTGPDVGSEPTGAVDTTELESAPGEPPIEQGGLGGELGSEKPEPNGLEALDTKPAISAEPTLEKTEEKPDLNALMGGLMGDPKRPHGAISRRPSGFDSKPEPIKLNDTDFKF